MSPYALKLSSREWQERRAEAVATHGAVCNRCSDDREHLHVHHHCYRPGREPWQYEVRELEVLCASCHRWQHQCEALPLAEVVAIFDQLSAAYARAGQLARKDMKRWLFLRGYVERAVGRLAAPAANDPDGGSLLQSAQARA